MTGPAAMARGRPADDRPAAPRDGLRAGPSTGPGAGPQDERQSRYFPVECAACGAIVLAAKFSFQHTSVQWDAAAVRQCAEFARRAALGEQAALIERCGAIRASIEAAVLRGELPVVPP